MNIEVITDDFSDLVDVDVHQSEDGDYPAISVEEAAKEIAKCVEDARNFMEEQFLPEWERAQEFYNGETDIMLVDGRSQVTKTTVRDAIRSIKPSAMRVLMASTSIVEYDPASPVNFAAATIAQVQTEFNNQLFWRYGGFKIMLNSFHNAALKRFSIMKAFHHPELTANFIRVTNADPVRLMEVSDLPHVRIISYDEETQEAELAVTRQNGSIKVCETPLHTFFFDEDAIGVEPGEFTVIGESSSATVSEARALGIDYDGDWLDLDDEDTEENEGVGESEARRGYIKTRQSESNSVDVAKHSFLLTEAYAEFDLLGLGTTQLYRFWLGGTSFKYLTHDRVEETPYAVGQIDPEPHAFAGKSIYDILKEEQNTQTSLLRATCDNAHSANNPRLAYHESLVNQQDLMAKALGHPIRVKQPGMIQEVGVTSQVASMLPLLKHLEDSADKKAGVTNAATGLDPSALQSTNEDAVRNTISLSLGQIELMVRVFVETGLTVLFRKLLILSIRHDPAEQMLEMNGKTIGVNQYKFATDIPMKASVGIGVPDIPMQLAALDHLMAKQEEYMARFGLNNPLCNVQQYFNAFVDKSKLMGINNFGRYFSQITPDTAAQLQQIMDKAAEDERQEKPSESLAVAESIRADARIKEQQLENARQLEDNNRKTRTDMIKALLADDLKRDEMAQKLAIEEAKLTGQNIDRASLDAQQTADRDYKLMELLIRQAQEREQLMATVNQNNAAKLNAEMQDAGQPNVSGVQRQANGPLG